MDRREFLAKGLAVAAASGVSGKGMALSTDGYFVPAEESPHQRTFMQWPVSRRVHPDPVFLDMTQQTIADIANAISEFEPVVMLAASDDHSGARQKLSAAIDLWDIPTEDLWCRDAGPLFVVDDRGNLAVSHIRFNGWGRKQVHTRDARIAEQVAARLGLGLLPSGLHGEPGGVEQDGHGLLMAHESSWVIGNRNPAMARSEVETRLLAAYGADQMIWSPGVRGQDITDYHIDSLARFTGPGRVLINLPDDPDMSDPFHRAAIETYDVLTGHDLQVEVIPEPNRRRVQGYDFVASYANYYVCNGAVISAQFGDEETDQIARLALERHYPGREVVALNVDPLGQLGGGIHCATQQMPAV
ncbi:MAG: agmatine deiminase family protein [Pseudomonadota bacterium]